MSSKVCKLCISLTNIRRKLLFLNEIAKKNFMKYFATPTCWKIFISRNWSWISFNISLSLTFFQTFLVLLLHSMKIEYLIMHLNLAEWSILLKDKVVRTMEWQLKDTILILNIFSSMNIQIQFSTLSTFVSPELFRLSITPNVFFLVKWSKKK